MWFWEIIYGIVSSSIVSFSFFFWQVSIASAKLRGLHALCCLPIPLFALCTVHVHITIESYQHYCTRLKLICKTYIYIVSYIFFQHCKLLHPDDTKWDKATSKWLQIRGKVNQNKDFCEETTVHNAQFYKYIIFQHNL